MKKITRKPMPTQFKQLVAKIRVIDPKAADWLVRHRSNAKYGILIGANYLDSLLVWAHTPQGHTYWKDIFNKLNELNKLNKLPEFLKPQA